MTERIGGAPDPADSPTGEAAGPGSAQPAPAFWNLAAVRRSDAVVEALATRSALPPADPAGAAGIADLLDPADPAGWRDDPAARLLRALVADVDAGAPELPDRRASLPPDRHSPPGRRVQSVPAVQPVRQARSGRPQPGGPGNEPGPGGGPRRGPRAIVLLGVVGPLLTGVLATTGVAAAQSGSAEWPSPGAGERAGREREPQAKAQPAGRKRSGAGRTRDGVVSPAAGGVRWIWPETRLVVFRARRDGREDDEAQGPGDVRDPRKTPRPAPRAGGPWPLTPRDGGSGGDEPRDTAPEPRGVLPFVQPELWTPGIRQDPPGTHETHEDVPGEHRATPDASGEPGVPAL